MLRNSRFTQSRMKLLSKVTKLSNFENETAWPDGVAGLRDDSNSESTAIYPHSLTDGVRYHKGTDPSIR